MTDYNVYQLNLDGLLDGEDFDTPPPLVKLTGQIYPRTGR